MRTKWLDRVVASQEVLQYVFLAYADRPKQSCDGPSSAILASGAMNQHPAVLADDRRGNEPDGLACALQRRERRVCAHQGLPLSVLVHDCADLVRGLVALVLLERNLVHSHVGRNDVVSATFCLHGATEIEYVSNIEPRQFFLAAGVEAAQLGRSKETSAAYQGSVGGACAADIAKVPSTRQPKLVGRFGFWHECTLTNRSAAVRAAVLSQHMDHRDSTFDVIVVGGGIAGVSIGYELAADRSVCLLEQESTLAFHTTGRSAALFLETYGNEPIRALTSASREFMSAPPEPWDSELLSPRSLLQFASHGRADALETMFATVRGLTPDAQLISPAEAATLFPPLRPERVDLALYEPGSMEIDVHALHQGFVRGLRSRGGVVATSSAVVGLRREHGLWRVDTADGTVRRAAVLIDAAGAWADSVATLAGAARIGLRPLRRTIFMISAPEDVDTSALPTLSDVDETFYLKPEGTQILCSPADETPTEPSDARPDEIEIARALDAVHDTTTLTARHVRSSWAGLRSFVADRTPVVGFDDRLDGFFWCAGQGGYGIQTAGALARVGAALVRGESVPDDVLARGLRVADLAPGRAMAATVNE